MTRLPQVLRNVRVPAPVADLEARLRPTVARVEATLGGRGRVLIRPSGTEPLVRVMVEAPSEGEAADVRPGAGRRRDRPRGRMICVAIGPGCGLLTLQRMVPQRSL